MRSRGRDREYKPARRRRVRRTARCYCSGAVCVTLGERRHEQQIVAGAIESLEQPLRRGHEQRASRALDQTLACEPTEHERHRLARGAHQLAQQAVARATELDRAVLREEALVRGEPTERGDQPLLDRKRRELAQLLQQRGPLRHDLAEQCERAIGLLAHERAEVRGAEEQRLRLLVGARVGRVLAVRRQPFGAKRFTGCRHPGDEPPPRAHAASQHHASPHDDEHPVCVRAPLIDLKTSGPRRSCRVALQVRFSRSRTGARRPGLCSRLGSPR